MPYLPALRGIDTSSPLYMLIGDVIQAQNRFRGMRANPYTEMGEPAAGGPKGFSPGATTPQTSFGEPDLALRRTMEMARYGRELTDFERSQMPKPQWAPGEVKQFPRTEAQSMEAQKAYERLIKRGAFTIIPKSLDVNNLEHGWDALLQQPFQRGSAANQARDVQLINDYLATPPRPGPSSGLSDAQKYQEALLRQLFKPSE